MANFVGSIRRNDLEGGFYELVTDSGESYRLEGKPIDASKVGQRVRVAGKVSTGGFGIHMTSSPALQVEKIEDV